MNFDVCIIGGLGRVGLPLGLTLAANGAAVAAFDLDTKKRAQVRSGEAPFFEPGMNILSSNFYVVDEPVRAEHTIVTVGTPIDEYQNARPEKVFGAVLALKDLNHVCLRSTVFPGTTRRLAAILAEHGSRPAISFCPERIVEGRAMAELRELPQIVAGLTPAAEALAAGLFKRWIPGIQTVPATVEEAELAKLFLNAWRYVRFAAANQFYELATELGVSYEGVRRAMTKDYPRGQDLPGPGFAAGPCLAKDTMQLAAAAPNGFPLGQSARLVNEGLPDFIVRRLRGMGVLNNRGKVGILGMAFKSDIDDVRDSLGFKLKRLLEFAGAAVMLSDEHHRPAEPSQWFSKEAILAGADVVIVGVPHFAYVGLEIPSHAYVVDMWGVTRGGKRL